MRLCVLASGSSGNSTYIETDETSILIDAGLSLRRIRNNLDELGKEPNELNGIFITHEHTDHTKGLEKLSNNHQIPVFINRKTFNAANLYLEHVNIIKKDNIELNDLQINPISISHDAVDPVGYHVRNNGKSTGVFTDLGIANDHVKHVIKKANAMVLESNHDIDMVINGRYPYHLKQRILGEKGHLSNIDAGLLVKDNATEKLKHVFLAHISKNNNTDDLAMNTFSELTKKNKIKRTLTNHNQRTEFVTL